MGRIIGQIVHTADGMLIQCPAAVGHGIVKEMVFHQILLPQDVIAHDTAGFPLARHIAHPVQREIRRTMVTAVFDMIPNTVENLQQFIADILTVSDDIILPAAQFDPPVAGVNARLGPPDGFAVAVLAVLQILFRVSIGPVGLVEGHRMAHVHGGEHQGVAHGEAVCHVLRMGLIEGFLRLTAHHVIRPRKVGKGTVAGGIDENIRLDDELLFCGQLGSEDFFDSSAIHLHIDHGGVQHQGQILLRLGDFPINGIGNAEGILRIEIAVFQGDLFHKAGFAGIFAQGMLVRSGDVHPDLGAVVAA